VNFDTPLFLQINEFARATPWLHGIVLAYANDGIVLFALLMLAGWWVARRAADPLVMGRAIWAPLGMALALAVNQLFVAEVGEPRPYTSLSGLLVLAHHSHDPSFPSDHAVMAGAVAAGLFGVSRGLGWLATIAAAVMAFARIYIAAHYPHDVAAGLVVGAVISMLGYLALRRILAWLVSLVESTPLRWVLTSAPAASVGRSHALEG
jgi:membrane-associated phospholipid phosphatase